MHSAHPSRCIDLDLAAGPVDLAGLEEVAVDLARLAPGELDLWADLPTAHDPGIETLRQFLQLGSIEDGQRKSSTPLGWP